MDGLVKVLVYLVIGLAIAAGLAIFVLTIVVKAKNKEIFELRTKQAALETEIKRLKAREEMEHTDDQSLLDIVNHDLGKPGAG